MVIVPKRDGNIRIIVDMRVANQAIKKERHPIPTVEEIVQKLSRACHFSKLDLRSGYHQLELGLCRHKRLTLEVTSASEYYQQTLERKIFYDLQNMRNISGDVIIWGKSQREHGFYLQKDLQQIQEHGLALTKEK